MEQTTGQDERWQFLREEVASQLAAYRRRRRRDKRKAFALQTSTVTLSATVTVLVGLRTADAARAWLLNIALGLGALTTVLAAVEAFFGHRRLWVLRTATVHRLEALERRIAFHTAGPAGPGARRELDACMTLLEEILADDQRTWTHLREGAAGGGLSPRPEEVQGEAPVPVQGGDARRSIDAARPEDGAVDLPGGTS